MTYSVVLDKVVKDKGLMNVTRLLAAEMMSNPYLTVSDFFSGLNDEDIDILTEVSENDEDERYGDLILLTEMLTTAEGISIDEDDEEAYVENVTHRLRAFISFLALESLERKGLVRIYRENMSFGEDYMDKRIAEAIKK